MRKAFPLLLLGIHIALCAGMAPRAFAGDMTAECPGILTEDVLKPGRIVPGWVTVPSQQHLNAAGMMAGAPETETYLVPDTTTKTKQTWAFAKGGERWLWCGYSGVRLMRKLDDKATSCTITTRTKKPELRMSAAMVCK